MHKYLFGLSLAALVAPAVHAEEIKFKPLLDARLRYETVDQTPFADDADSVTMRVRSGAEFSSGPFTFLAEAEATLAIDEDYNSGVNGKAGFPIVADPENIELNRIQLQYKGIPKTVVTVGRQRINLDDQRFVGAVGWRQNEQTFDAVRVEWTGIKNLKADVTYSWSVRTIYGIDGISGTANQQAISGDNVFATLAYTTKLGTLTGFAYLVDQDEQPAAVLQRANQTYGARFAGAYPFSKAVKLGYALSYAHQSDYHNNPVDYSADYYAAELNLDAKGFKLTGGYELLGSDDGVKAFQTPLATLHKFNGWADKFLATPANGLEDIYGGLAYTLPKLGKTGPLTLGVVYHRFNSDRLDQHYGNEWDAQATLKLTKRLGFTAKYADYDAKALLTDTKKFIAQFDYAL